MIRILHNETEHREGMSLHGPVNVRRAVHELDEARGKVLREQRFRTVGPLTLGDASRALGISVVDYSAMERGLMRPVEWGDIWTAFGIEFQPICADSLPRSIFDDVIDWNHVADALERNPGLTLEDIVRPNNTELVDFSVSDTVESFDVVDCHASDVEPGETWKAIQYTRTSFLGQDGGGSCLTPGDDDDVQ